MKVVRTPIRILNFDCEARPLGWYGGDFTHKEVTVIGWCVLGEEPEARALTKDDRTRRRMLLAFRKEYDAAELIVGHYIRKFDLPLVSAMLAEIGEPPLGPKLTHDTKQDLISLHGVSKSQENLSALLGFDGKKHLTTQEWREANRLTPEGIRTGVERAIADVVQNMRLYEELKARSLLRPPRVWHP